MKRHMIILFNRFHQYFHCLFKPCSFFFFSRKCANLSVAAEAYCKVGMATADTMVTCYKTKYQYNHLRPITFIRANFNPTWVPLIPTPPLPDYTSAHLVQTGACARVVADIFGVNTTFTDNIINALDLHANIYKTF